MKISMIIILAVLAGVACNRQTLPQKSAAELNSVPVNADAVKDEPVEAPITEIEETLIPVEEEPPVESQYFVIIGSFRDKGNAMRYQAEIGEKGFSSVLLQNTEGFYRVSVKATDVLTEAREEIQRIRRAYPEHSDTWLLIRKE